MLASAHIRSWLPLAVLLAALASLFALGGDRAYLQRDSGWHSAGTAQVLAIAENLSPRHGFRSAVRVWRNEEGGFKYQLYDRFPFGS